MFGEGAATNKCGQDVTTHRREMNDWHPQQVKPLNMEQGRWFAEEIIAMLNNPHRAEYLKQVGWDIDLMRKQCEGAIRGEHDRRGHRRRDSGDGGTKVPVAEV